MSRADSPLSGRMIFAFGARRSGTYWLHQILSAHRDVDAIPSETFLFSDGIAPLLERFHHGARESPQTGAMYADRDLLLDAVRDFCDRVLGGFASGPERRLVERTPQHILFAELIGEIYPDAHLVHIVRDGRDVARSLLGRPWGPATAADAAREWRSMVRAGRAARSHPGYVEVRYESLFTEPRTEIERLFSKVGVNVGAEIVDGALSAAAVPVNVDPRTARIATGKWRGALSAEQVRDFELVAGDLLAELGYELASGLSPGGRDAPLAVRPPEPRWRSDPKEAARTLDRLLEFARENRPQAGVALLLLLAEGEGPSAVPGTPPRPQPGPVRRLVRRVRSPQQARGDRLEIAWESDAQAAERLMDELLTLTRAGHPEAAAQLLAEDATVTIVAGDGRIEARGADARAALTRALAEDEGIRGRQLRGEVFTGEPTAASVLAYELDDGSRTARVLLVTARAGRIRRLALHRLSAGVV